jgi:cytochrome c oxidase cbb3-type subunit 4
MDQGDWMGIATLLAFVAFCGVCVWAWSDRRRARFDEAAQLPFADEHIGGIERGERNE